MEETRVLFVDLNNSARFPALAIGYLVAVLRRGGIGVEVFSPLSEGVPGFSRDLPDTFKDHLQRRIYFSENPAVRWSRETLRGLHKARTFGPHPNLIGGLERAVAQSSPRLILVSAYLDHRASVEAVGAVAAAHGIPVVLGGPVFNHDRIAAEWSDIPGITRIYGGEADDEIVTLCHDLIAGRGVESPAYYSPRRPMVAPALSSLDDLPLPDFSDFPWALYPSRVLTVMAGRGCEWGRCTFCSDIATANGRGFRTRPLGKVLEELQVLSGLYETRNTFFLDIKLNSDQAMWNGLIDNYQQVLPGGKWVGTVHVAARGVNGLEADRLAAARRSGMMRISFGLESGSDRLNKAMGKGTSMARNIDFMDNANAAGLSVRASMMLGYPGETADDVEMTADMLRRHGHLLHRVRMSRFKAVPGTRFERLHARRPELFPGLDGFKWRYAEGRAEYDYRPARSRRYRKAKAAVLSHIYAINRRALPEEAAAFNGLM